MPFLDTDMLVVKELNEKIFLKKMIFCERQFDCEIQLM